MPDIRPAHDTAPPLQLQRRPDGLTLTTPHYRLDLDAARPYLRVSDAARRPYADLFLCPSVHTAAGLDRTARLEDVQVRESGGRTHLRFPLRGGVWLDKVLVLTCDARGIDAHVEVRGEGVLTDVLLFAGYYSGHLRWGSGLFESGAHFSEVFNPEPWGRERRTHGAGESSSVDVMGTSVPGKAHWFFTPAPLLYAFSRDAGGPVSGGSLGADQGGTPVGEATTSASAGPAPWLAASIVAPVDELTFTGFHYDAHEGAFSLRLSYEGQTRVSGTFRTPTLRLEFAADPYAAIARNAQLHRERGVVPAAPESPAPTWWSSPIQCGWGAQCHLAGVRGGRAPDHCTQANYDAFLTALDGHGLHPGILVLDDKWSVTYGHSEVDEHKWPDLRGWIDRAHARGQKVLLWWKAWDPEGLPPEACVTDDLGGVVAADPTSPAYREILARSVRRMLLDYGADGFKVDFSARTPSGPGLRRHGRAWGISLLHELLGLLRQEAKRAKPDALVMTHTPHPAFGDVSDMIRLNDVNTGANVRTQMLHRARVARAALPTHLIDTDNWPMPNIAAWREYVALQPELGVPSLYFATHVDGDGAALTAADAALVRATWARWDAQRRVDPLVVPPGLDADGA
ncbi:hypothetical protein HNQ07_003476 [Deinococcus metalli]|uniref:Alpha-galactosidase n=1 Tax=Deinococcus metalli TaxID=1141878 RepID=A0A7W8NRK1_9DEIO|nr:hypothetical protein [Deinococcus metalli]MBB5377975.1 hypothetical protein [Deinococcus metalli]GHF53480.1 hypothetical protein GCM10017781_32110 [Deinococcus metalli]